MAGATLMPGRIVPHLMVGATAVGLGGQGGGVLKPTSQSSFGPCSPVATSLNCAELAADEGVGVAVERADVRQHRSGRLVEFVDGAAAAGDVDGVSGQHGVED